MDIARIGSRHSGKGLAERFTGAVRIDPLFGTPDPPAWPGRSSPLPGARTAWHTHPLGHRDLDA